MPTLAALALAAILATSTSAATADDSGSAAKAAEVLAAAKAATGGGAWDTLEGSYERGAHNGRAYETWLDFRRYGMKVRNADGAVRAFDGETAWTAGPDGQVRRDTDPAALREAVVTAYVSNNGFFFPDRFPAQVTHLSTKTGADGATYEVIEADPAGGRPVELWFDRGSHRLTRVVDRAGPAPITVTLSDYRPVGDVLIAFRGVVTGPDGAVLDEGQVTEVAHRPVSRETFVPRGP